MQRCTIQNQPIFIPYETKTREFDGKLLLISHLLNAGFSRIFFGSRAGMKEESLLHRNGIYILKSLSANEEDFYKNLRSYGYRIVLIHVEGGIHYKDNRSSILSAYNPSLLKYVDTIFVFGVAIRDDIIKYCHTEAENKIVVSGEPRFDLLKPKFQTYFSKSVAKIKEKFGKFILVNTSFSVANPIVGKEALLRSWDNEPTYTDDTKKLLIKKMKFLNKVVENYLIAIKEISYQYSDYNFIIRPHPSECEKIYIKEFRGHKNLFVEKSGNVVDWILASEGIIHYDCTTGMEALLAGKPTISYLPNLDKDVIAWLPVELSKKSFTLDELKNDVGRIFNGDFNNNIEDKIFNIWQSYINNLKEESSPIIVKRIISDIWASHHPEKEKKLKSGTTSSNTKILWSTKTFFKDFVKNFLSERIQIDKIKFGKLEKFEVRANLSKLKEINNFNYDLKYKKIKPDVMFIHNRMKVNR